MRHALFTQLFQKCDERSDVILYEIVPLADKITEYFREGNGDAFHDSIIDMLNHLAIQYELYKEKTLNGKFNKTLKYLIFLNFLYLQFFVRSVPYKK